MKEKKQSRKWIYLTSGKAFRVFLFMLTFCACIAGIVFSALGVIIYGRDILEIDQENYFESTTYQNDMLTEAESVLMDIEYAYIQNAGFDKDFSITDVSKDTIYYYDMDKIIRDSHAGEIAVNELSDLEPYLKATAKANMYGFSDYSKVLTYLNASQANNNYIYFDGDAFKNLFKKAGKLNANYKYSEAFSESAYFLFEGINDSEGNLEDEVELEERIVIEAMDEFSSSYSDETEEIKYEVSTSVSADEEETEEEETTLTFAVYDPLQELFYSPGDDYFNPMGSYIYSAEELKQQLELAEKKVPENDTIFLWLRGYNYELNSIWANMMAQYDAVKETVRHLNSMKDNGSFVYYLKTPDFTCTNVKEEKDITSLGKLYGLKGAKSKLEFEKHVSDPRVLDNYQYTVGQLFDYAFPENTIFYFGVDPDRMTLNPDRSSWNYRNYNLFSKTAGLAIWISVILLILLVVQAVLLAKTAGKKEKNSAEIRLTFFDRLPTEIWAFVLLVLWGSAFFTLLFAWTWVDILNNWSKVGYLVSIGILSALPLGLVMVISLLSITKRVKVHNIWNKVFVRKVFLAGKNVTGRFWNARKNSEKILVLGVIYMVLNFISMVMVRNENPEGVLLFLCVQVIAVLVVVYFTMDLNTIDKGISEIAKGNLDYKCEIKGKSSLLKGLAEGVNHVGDGMKFAVETSLKNERLRTELITNVSHDLKTPLTSIINYVNLLKTEEMPTKEAEHYLEILEQKSQRLRHLTEDLVEAAKANTGNIELEKMPLAFDELMKQAIGEFEDKFSLRNLEVVASYPEEPIVIMADGRRMFRIIENVLQNVYKYALEGTRVYADLSKRENEAVFVLKNISAAPLNISPDELMERFKRGEASRTTEGSGLGLSIAKDLTKLQDGNFEIQLDGDLFKVVITFPEYVKPDKEE